VISAVIPIAIVAIVVGGVTASLVAYYRLQRHRADAVAMAAYRKLAEEAVTGQEELHVQLAELTIRLTTLEYLLRSVG
jgi:type II secretory pathway pseudopilin PulG